MEVKFCEKCLMPSSRPRIVFTDGVCNACRFAEERKTWDYAERREMFIDLVKSKKRHPAYDMIVPMSGGKDSAVIAYKLKHEYGFNPLCITFGQLQWTPAGIHNWHQVRNAGIDIRYWGLNQVVSRKLARRFLIERFHIKQHYDAAVNSVPVIAAKEIGIPLVCYAEFGEGEYGGLVLEEESYRRRNLEEVLEHQIGDSPLNWATDGISDADIWPYVYPDDIGDIEAVYFSYYNGWDIFQNAEYAKEKMNFQRVEPRTDGSFEGYDSIDDMVDGVDFYGMFCKFGFGRATRMASRLIQRGHITREQGLEYVRKYDGEFPEMYLGEVLDYVGMTRDEFVELADKHRNPEIWKQENGVWTLRHPPA